MEVVPTGDGDDDGVVWYRCPQCQGFLPKLKSAEEAPAKEASGPASEIPVASGGADGAMDDDLPYDSPAEMMAAQRATADAAEPSGEEPEADLLVSDPDAPASVAPLVDPGSVDDPDENESKDAGEDEVPAEPVAEYAAKLAEALQALPADAPGGRPYRPWETYEIGQCIQHLAWEDCGIVVGKESLPGGRRVVKVFFQEAGVIRLIEQAPQ